MVLKKVGEIFKDENGDKYYLNEKGWYHVTLETRLVTSATFGELNEALIKLEDKKE